MNMNDFQKYINEFLAMKGHEHVFVASVPSHGLAIYEAYKKWQGINTDQPILMIQRNDMMHGHYYESYPGSPRGNDVAEIKIFRLGDRVIVEFANKNREIVCPLEKISWEIHKENRRTDERTGT